MRLRNLAATRVPIEIEKKFRLTKKQHAELEVRLPQLGAERQGEEFEVNTLYSGDALEVGHSVLRLRRIGKRGILTYKERFPTRSTIKHQREDETSVGDPDAMELILEAIGFTPALIYEKRRETWRLGKVEIVIDELPFGLFMEIEGTEQEIRELENKLSIKRLRAETATYPQLTLTLGTNRDGIIESRFPEKK
ncbi:MAG TPA: class IV adenylate cyclase [Pyrinomonadaceae bacterium]|nr:class IV adenylate cyclase [Pyrinomonadaceae bacterium]